MEKILRDEKGACQIDVSKATWFSGEMHQNYTSIAGSILKDVDWVICQQDKVLLVEYKNFDMTPADAFKNEVKSDTLAVEIAKKYYDSQMFLLLNQLSMTEVHYVFVLQRTLSDSVLRKKLRNKISKKLPFKLQDAYPLDMLQHFEVQNIEEWNAHDTYGIFPISQVTP